MMLFTERSVWTMVHGIGFGGAALLALAAAIFALYLLAVSGGGPVSEAPSRAFARLATFIASTLWLTSLVGTYLVFPAYRAGPPEGTTGLEGYPRALILAEPQTVWLHAFAMETKEHLPWIAAMLATAVAFVAWRYRSRLLDVGRLRTMAAALLATSFVIVAYVSVLGVFINKVAPVE
jgi:hypothetical protein